MFEKHEIKSLIKLADSVKTKDETLVSKSVGKYKLQVYKNPDNSRILFVLNSSGINVMSMRSRKEIEQFIYALQDVKDFV